MSIVIAASLLVVSLFGLCQPAEATQPVQGTAKVVCHYMMCYDPRNVIDDIDSSLCTHVVFAEASLQNNDVNLPCPASQFSSKIVNLRSKGIKVIIKLGGWEDSDNTALRSNKYSILISSVESRLKFLPNALAFMDRHSFDGMEVEWLYPNCWKGDCSRGDPADKANFASWIEQLRIGFHSRNKTLSVSVSQTSYHAARAYDAPKIARNVDWLTILTQYYYGNWNVITGYHSPLFGAPGTDGDTASSVTYWQNLGASKEKLVIVVPFFGVGVTLKNAAQHQVGDEIVQNGSQDVLPYYQLCQGIKNGEWNIASDPTLRTGPYVYAGTKWASFNNPAMVERKGKYIRDEGIGGAAIVFIQYDDRSQNCAFEAYPLLRALNRGMRAPKRRQSASPPPFTPTIGCQDEVRPFIYNGDLARIEDHPYLVSLQTKKGHFCGGVILDNNIVLTAAHCTVINKVEAEDILVVAGRTCQSQEIRAQQVLEVDSILTHPEHKRVKNDIALIKTKSPFRWRRHVQPAKIVTEWQYDENETVTVAGWGKIEDGTLPDNLYKVDVTIVSDSECKRTFRSVYDSESTFCLFSHGKDSCDGDSGSPLTNDNGELIGLVSYGRKDHCGKAPSVASKVAFYLDWIETEMDNLNDGCYYSSTPNSSENNEEQGS